MPISTWILKASGAAAIAVDVGLQDEHRAEPGRDGLAVAVRLWPAPTTLSTVVASPATIAATSTTYISLSFLVVAMNTGPVVRRR